MFQMFLNAKSAKQVVTWDSFRNIIEAFIWSITNL